MLQRFGQTQKPDDAHWAAWACVLAPDATKDWPKAVALAEKAAKSDPKSATYRTPWARSSTAPGGWRRRSSGSRRPTGWSETGRAKCPSPAYTWFFLAMAHHRLGHREEAKKWLDKAVAWTEKTIREADQGTTYLPWNRRLTLKLLREEAEALLKSAPASPSSKPAVKEKEKPRSRVHHGGTEITEKRRQTR